MQYTRAQWYTLAQWYTDRAAGVGSVAFECDGSRPTCVNHTRVWSCADLDCTNPRYRNMCAMALGYAGLRGTIPAELGDLRCADRIQVMCASAPPRAMHTRSMFASRVRPLRVQRPRRQR